MNKVKLREVMWFERRVDIFTGPNADEHRPYWNYMGAGDKEDSNDRDLTDLVGQEFPVGTKVIVQVPVCPDCDMESIVCDCGFDWKEWAEEQYE